MKFLDALLIGTVSMAFFGASGGEASAQSQSQNQNPNQKKLRRDRVKMAADVGSMALGVGGIALGVVSFNPAVAGLGAASLGVGTASLGRHTYQYVKRRDSGQGGATASPATTNDAQTESLVAVPGRPGYSYYPSNPNQLYFDANAAAAAEAVQARIPQPAPINVVIANTAKDGRTVRYTVSGTPYEVPPGYIQVLTAPQGSVIAYDRGDAVGVEQFTLASGAYEFRTAEQGWRFYSMTPTTATVGKAKDVPRPTEATRAAVEVR
jgi:hypothetical protein